MILDEVATYLQSSGIGTIGVSIFKGSLPSSPLDRPVVVLYEYSGIPLDRTQDGNFIDTPRIQFQSRGPDYETTRSLLVQVYNLIEPLKNTILSGVKYIRLMPIQTPAFLGRDENNRPMFIFNAQAMKEFS